MTNLTIKLTIHPIKKKIKMHAIYLLPQRYYLTQIKLLHLCLIGIMQSHILPNRMSMIHQIGIILIMSPDGDSNGDCMTTLGSRMIKMINCMQPYLLKIHISPQSRKR